MIYKGLANKNNGKSFAYVVNTFSEFLNVNALMLQREAHCRW